MRVRRATHSTGHVAWRSDSGYRSDLEGRTHRVLVAIDACGVRHRPHPRRRHHRVAGYRRASRSNDRVLRRLAVHPGTGLRDPGPTLTESVDPRNVRPARQGWRALPSSAAMMTAARGSALSVAMRGVTRTVLVVLILVVLILTGCAARLAGAPSTRECVERWNGALDTGSVSGDVRPRDVFLISQGAADWNGRYPVCWLTIVESDHVCQSFYTPVWGDEWTATLAEGV